MTARELYVYILTEINKLGAPSLLLEDFIYFANKAVQQYTNKAYNKFEVNQQATDDLRVLRSDAIIKIEQGSDATPTEKNRFYCTLPADYLHLLTCFVIFESVNGDIKSKQCGEEGEDESKIYSPARRLTADQYSDISRNAYYKPTYKRPYYTITNTNDTDSVFPKPNEELVPTNSTMDDLIKSLNGTDRVVEGRQSNTTPVIMNIHCGKTNIYKPVAVKIAYIKSPMKISLTNAQLAGIDTSQVLEFPDYVCYEIINELTKLILENNSDPRFQTNGYANMSVAGGGSTNSAPDNNSQ